MKGKSKRHSQKRGSILEVLTNGPRKKFRVLWNDSSTDEVFPNSLEKIPASAPTGPFIGPTIAGRDTPLPHREDELYEMDSQPSSDDDDSVMSIDLQDDNEVPPEDGALATPDGPPQRYFLSLHFLIVFSNFSHVMLRLNMENVDEAQVLIALATNTPLAVNEAPPPPENVMIEPPVPPPPPR